MSMSKLLCTLAVCVALMLGGIGCSNISNPVPNDPQARAALVEQYAPTVRGVSAYLTKTALQKIGKGNAETKLIATAVLDALNKEEVVTQELVDKVVTQAVDRVCSGDKAYLSPIIKPILVAVVDSGSAIINKKIQNSMTLLDDKHRPFKLLMVALFEGVANGA
jgi:hypothetical protein